MANKLFRATHTPTGKKVEVYKRWNGQYVDYSDCETLYEKVELKFD